MAEITKQDGLEAALDPTAASRDNGGPEVVGFTGPQGSLYKLNAPRVPAPTVPAAPEEEDTGEPEVHPVDSMAKEFTNLAASIMKNTPGSIAYQPPAAAPGSFRDKLGAALGGGAEALAAGIGDAAAASQNAPRGSGWLGGIARTLGAREQREEREAAAKFERQERLKNDQINLAKANIEMRHLALNVQVQEKAIRDQAASAGSTFIDSLRDNYHVQDNISQDQLSDMASKDPSFLRTHTGRITGYRPVFGANGQPQKDSNGNDIEEPIWAVADIAPGDTSKQYKVSDAVSKKWEESGLHHVAAGTLMPVSVANEMDARAARYSSTLGMLDKARVEPLPDNIKDQLSSTLEDSEVQHAIAMKPGSVLDGLYTAQSNTNAHLRQAQAAVAAATKSGNPQAIQAAQQQLDRVGKTAANIDKVINLGFTDKERSEYAKEKEAAAKDAERERHDRAQEVISQNKIAALQASNDPADAKQLGEFLASAQMDPSQLSKRAKSYNMSLTAANEYSLAHYGMPFDIAQAQTDYRYANQKTTKDTLNMINGMTEPGGAIEIATAAATRLPQFDEQTVNKVFNIAKSEFGSDSATNFHTAMLGLADEYSKVMGGGVSSDTGRQQALDILKAAYSKGQMQGAIDTMRSDIAARKKAIVGNNRYLMREYGVLPQTPAQPQGSAQNPPPSGQPKPKPANATKTVTFNGVEYYTDDKGNNLGTVK